MSFSAQDIEEFKTEAQELLDLAEKSLMELDRGGDFKSCFDSVFRGFHNLKGSAGMMEFLALQSHTHELETILMSFKDKGEIPKPFLDLFLSGVDAARTILDGKKVDFNFTPNQQEESLPVFCDELPDFVINDFLSECNEIIEKISRHLECIEKKEYSKDTLDELYREVHSLKGSSYLFSLKKIGDIAHAMESSLEKVRNSTHSPSIVLLNCLFKSLNAIEELVKRVRKKESDEDFNKLIPKISKALSIAAENLEPISIKQGLKIEEVALPVTKETKEVEGMSSIRVPVSLLDNLMTLMGEMVLVRNQVLQYANTSEDLEFSSMSKRLNVVTSEIQEEMMKTRMQPIGNVLDKFNRVVRDLSHELNKSIDLTIQGSDTELDKSLLEAIKDPLTHIVRNSCDHGIENPETRRQNGKAEQGKILIKAYHEGGQVIIEIVDDGKGLNKEQLIKKALEKGIINSSQSSDMSDKEAYDLIFAPGFSTAAQVTNVSGRGVGMDVVRTNIEKIGGSVELDSRLGQGTAIKIKIPLTLAIIPALIVKCGDGIFSIPQVKIEELVRVDSCSGDQKIEYLHGVPIYRLRGDILPLVDLNSVLANKENIVAESGVTNIVVLNAEKFSFGVIVDEIKDTVDIVVKPLNKLLKSLQVYSGATILGDGIISLILDVIGISKVAHLSEEHYKNKRDDKEQSKNEYQDLLVVKLNSQTRHALALNYVQRLEEFKASDVEYSGDERVIRYRGEILPLVSSNKELGYETNVQGNEILHVVVVARRGKIYGIEVNAIVDTLTTNLEIKPAVKDHVGIFGNISDEKGLIVVIDPFQLIDRAFPDLEEVNNYSHQKVDISIQKKILLVEDTVYFQKAIRSFLEKNGHSVLLAHDGKEALEILDQNQDFDLIISDIEMPRLNGFDLAKTVRKHRYYSSVPMMALSSKADSHHKREGLNAGFDIYLEKFRPEMVLAAVSELCGKKGRAA